MVCSGVLPDAEGRKAAMAQATIATVRIPTAREKGEGSERREREREKAGKGRGLANRQYKGSSILAFTDLNDKTPRQPVTPTHCLLEAGLASRFSKIEDKIFFSGREW